MKNRNREKASVDYGGVRGGSDNGTQNPAFDLARASNTSFTQMVVKCVCANRGLL